MVKQIAIAGVVTLGLVVLVELVMLAKLKSSVNGYATYWKNYSSQGTLVYVALGDSAAQGIGASSPNKGYVGLLAQRLADKTDQQVRVVNLSVSGAKIDDVIKTQVPQLKDYQADVITVEIGGNNVVNDDITKFEADYEQLAKLLPKGTFVADIPYYGGRIRKNAQAVVASQAIAGSANRYGLKLVKLQQTTKDRDSLLNYSADLFHPSNRGYRVWTDAFWAAIEPEIKL